MFVRTKRVKGKEYAYLVKSQWRGGKPRQKIIGYLGAVIRLEKRQDATFQGIFSASHPKAIVKGLMRRELIRHGFEGQNCLLKLGGVEASCDSLKISRKGKPVVLRINEGFMCEATLKRLLRELGKPPEGLGGLPSAILEAGIGIDKGEFQELILTLVAKHKA